MSLVCFYRSILISVSVTNPFLLPIPHSSLIFIGRTPMDLIFFLFFMFFHFSIFFSSLSDFFHNFNTYFLICHLNIVEIERTGYNQFLINCSSRLIHIRFPTFPPSDILFLTLSLCVY